MDEDLPFEFDSSDDANQEEMPFDLYLKSHQQQSQSVALHQICAQDVHTPPLAAFDTNVVRKRTPKESKSWRKHSSPVKEAPPKMIPLHEDGPTPLNPDGTICLKSEPPTPDILPASTNSSPAMTMDMDVEEDSNTPKEPGTPSNSTPRAERPYKCKIGGCPKSYKNPGGLKYHMQHGHCEGTALYLKVS